MGMRIRSVNSDTTQILKQVQEKQDSSGQQFQQHMHDQNKKKENADENLTEEQKQQKLQDALAEFTALNGASTGLTASPMGQGPGLKVILKDGTGAIIRQMTGEEFLQLRDTAKGDGQARGKILDQKF